MRIGLPNVLVLLVLVGAGAFAAGSAIPSSAPPRSLESPPPPAAELRDPDDDLPPGHPTVGSSDPQDQPPQEQEPAPERDLPLEWVAPPRWQSVPSTSSMRLATFRVPRAPGDTADAEMSVVRAGGSAEANARRWIEQFDAEARKGAKLTTRKVGALEVTLVEVDGTYSGGMGKESAPQPGFGLLGAIVGGGTLADMPFFFKLVGPTKSVHAARAEFDAMIGSLSLR